MGHTQILDPTLASTIDAVTVPKRLSAADSWFLYLEGPTMGLHVTGLMLLDPSSSPDTFDYSRFEELLEARIGLLDALRYRVVPVPFGIDHPLLVHEEPDLSKHVRHVVLPGKPGSAKAKREWRALLDEFCASHLDRTRPLWEMLFVEGLPEGRVALAAKLHHAMIDGISGVGFMADLLDLRSDAPLHRPDAADLSGDSTGGAPEDNSNSELPTRVRSGEAMMLEAITHRLTDPMRPVRAVARTGSSLLGAARTLFEGRGGGPDQAAPFRAPHTPLNGSLTPRRSVAYGSVSLERVKRIRRSHDVTLNDVFLAACASALRDHLQRTGELPDRPLVASVPVSMHDAGSGGSTGATNQVSNMFVNLPVNVGDPIERLMGVHRSALGAKAVQGAMGPEMLGDLVDLMPPPLLSGATSLFVESRMTDRLPPVHSLIVSNVPGPDFPLYLAGAEVVGMYPFGPLMEGSGLNISVLSLNGHLDIGLIACPDLVPGLDELLAGIISGFSELETT